MLGSVSSRNSQNHNISSMLRGTVLRSTKSL